MFIRGKVVALVVVVVVALCPLLLGGEQTLHDAPIDVSRGEYEAALSRWNGSAG